jgi:hypothetical protein
MRRSLDMPTVPSIRAAALLLACAALALPLAACGGSSGSGGGGDASAAATDDNDRDTAQLKLQQCLRDNGVEGPRAGGGDSGPVTPSEAEIERLREALDGPCREQARAAFGSVSEEDRAAFEDARVRMTACLEEHGIDMPEPQPGRPMLMRLDPDDEELRAAMEACREELPEELREREGPGMRFRAGPRP